MIAGNHFSRVDGVVNIRAPVDISDEIESDQIELNQIKSNQVKSNQNKLNQIKPNQIDKWNLNSLVLVSSCTFSPGFLNRGRASNGSAPLPIWWKASLWTNLSSICGWLLSSICG
jgi:hypothetical protein